MPSPRQKSNAPARRSNPGGSNPGGTISDVKLGHIVAALGRYRPVLAVVGIILLLAVVLDGPAVIGGVDPYAASNQGNRVQTGASATTTTTAAEAAEDNFTAPSPLGGGNASRTPAASPAAASGDDGSSFAYTPPPASTSGGGSSSGSSGSFGGGGEPLTVTAAAWASRAGGTPLGDAGVPDDSLPVGTRLGQDDKRSFVRLEGDEGMLTLVPVDEEDGQRNPADAVIRMCQITEGGWAEDEAMSFDDAPPYDDEECIDGIRNEDDGSWTFSLLVFANPTDNRGFALVPGEDAPIDFQVAFART